MFGSNDDKKAPLAGEKKGLFGWWRKKPQAEEQPVAETEPRVEQPAAAEPAPAPEQALAAQAEPVAARAEPTPEPVIDVVPASVPVEPLVQPVTQPEPQPVAQPVVAEVPQAVVPPVEPAPVAAPVQPEPAAEAPAVVAQPEPEPEIAAQPEPEPEPQAQPVSEPSKLGFFARLKQGLSKTSASLGEGMASLFLGKKAIDDDLLDEIETRLLTADVGVEATTTIVQNLTKRVARKELADSEALYKALQEELASLLRPVEQPLTITRDKQPYVILVVGVNGVGKTTTIGKLAKKLQLDGKKVMLAAGDTFRAAAVEQLQVWGERNNIAVIAQHTGADSASVIFDAVQAAKARGVDVLIADTAGRLHTKDNLMEELKKVRRVIGKLDETAPHEVLLVLDAGTGQNAINQARQFNNAVELTGLALTKLDGTAKGGVIFALAKQFGLPIRYIGVGEGIDDLRTFEADAFVRALFETREIA
ncbi:signal recognition particle-docking protein FtsY [Pseudomonas sp. Pseusp97]|uniref:signal recognition particle-docking protein FtsY n=1 Tax=Pseudomonas sp. Pseusp97 TaxID=3243065 RepID=UPI0039A614F8